MAFFGFVADGVRDIFLTSNNLTPYRRSIITRDGQEFLVSSLGPVHGERGYLHGHRMVLVWIWKGARGILAGKTLLNFVRQILERSPEQMLRIYG